MMTPTPANSVSYACSEPHSGPEDVSVIWRFVRDIFFSCVISLTLMMGAVVGLFGHASEGSYASRPEYRTRARESVRRSMEFILSPIDRPSRLVPRYVQSIPLIGDASLAAATFIAFPPCFWVVVAFVGLRVNRALKLVTSEKLMKYFEAKYGHLGRFARNASTSKPPKHEI